MSPAEYWTVSIFRIMGILLTIYRMPTLTGLAETVGMKYCPLLEILCIFYALCYWKTRVKRTMKANSMNIPTEFQWQNIHKSSRSNGNLRSPGWNGGWVIWDTPICAYRKHNRPDNIELVCQSRVGWWRKLSSFCKQNSISCLQVWGHFTCARSKSVMLLLQNNIAPDIFQYSLTNGGIESIYRHLLLKFSGAMESLALRLQLFVPSLGNKSADAGTNIFNI